MKRFIGTALSVLLVSAGALVAVIVPATHAAPVICEEFGGTYIQDDFYRVQNNVWGADTAQCIDVDQSGGFTVTTAEHNKATNGAPAAYPSIYAGCHWGQCTTGSELPMQASAPGFDDIGTSVSYTYPSSGTWNAAYDLWFDPTPRTDGQNTGAEMMIWLNRQGSIQPIGSHVDTVNLAGATWEVWFGTADWNVITYLRTSPANSVDFAVDTFYTDAVNRGYAERSWYLTSVQAGSEPWIGGAGLSVDSFTYTTTDDGDGEDTTAPTAPQGLEVTDTTSTSVSLSWSPSSDDVGVTGYDVLRREGTSGDFLPIGTATNTTFSSDGLTPSTQYQFLVRARDAAGNVSADSDIVTAYTEAGNGGGEGCAATDSLQSQWGSGFVMDVDVTAGEAISGWTITFTLEPGHSLVGSWGADVTVDGQSVTAESLTWNGDLAPGESARPGFQIQKPDGSNASVQDLACTAG